MILNMFKYYNSMRIIISFCKIPALFSTNPFTIMYYPLAIYFNQLIIISTIILFIINCNLLQLVAISCYLMHLAAIIS